jgi:hypothetical protein
MILPAAGLPAGPWRGREGRAGQRLKAHAETVVDTVDWMVGGRLGRRSDDRIRIARRLRGASAMRPIGLVRLAHGL